MKVRRRDVGVPNSVIELLITGEVPNQSDEDFWAAFECTHDRNRLAAEWQNARDSIMKLWIEDSPGTRPWAWWEFDAPRWNDNFPARWAGREAALSLLAEPRRRVGGFGDPAYEHLNYWPEFDAGIPTFWVSSFDEAYYNGRARDVHGQPIGTEYHEGHFRGRAPRREDPPLFESQATYLDRHGLLTNVERRRLSADAFLPQPLKLDGDS